ncbi:MAG: hypothetical protein ACLRZH_11905 [Ruthenibacterium lactatiformans]
MLFSKETKWFERTLIVLEGLDGSGKATQTGLLYEALCGRENRR